jgi:hypothetical protein
MPARFLQDTSASDSLAYGIVQILLSQIKTSTTGRSPQALFPSRLRATHDKLASCLIMEAGMGLLDLLRLQKAEAEERLHGAELTTEMREIDEVYLAEIERLIANG